MDYNQYSAAVAEQDSRKLQMGSIVEVLKELEESWTVDKVVGVAVAVDQGSRLYGSGKEAGTRRQTCSETPDSTSIEIEMA
jgi:hypothetical protein